VKSLSGYAVFAILFGALQSCPLLFADELVLQEGGQLNGTVMARAGASIRFKTSDGDVLRIRWRNVEGLKCENAVVSDKQGNIHEGAIAIGMGPEGKPWVLAAGTHVMEKRDVKMINPEPWRLGQGWNKSGRINISMLSERGNTDRDSAGVDARIMLRDVNDRLAASVSLENDAEDGNEIQSKWSADARSDRFLSKKTYLSVAGSARHDKFANLDLRSSLGAGVGYQLYDTRRISLLMESLLVHVREDAEGTDSETYLGALLQVNFEHGLIPERLICFANGSGTFNIERAGDYFVDSSAGVREPLLGGAVLTAEARNEYTSIRVSQLATPRRQTAHTG
jgi:hypothetical protein